MIWAVIAAAALASFWFARLAMRDKRSDFVAIACTLWLMVGFMAGALVASGG